MKKKRVLALLLALSMAVSMNGMSVLAAGSGVQELSVAAEADYDSISAGEGRISAQETGDQVVEDTSEDQTDSDISDGEEKIEEDTKPEDAGDLEDTLDENDDLEGTQTPDDQDYEGGQNPVEGTDQPLEDADSQDSDGADEPAVEDETDADNDDVESESDGEDEADAVPSVPVFTVAPKIMSFTDETGLRITYNANEEYQYTIDESGTLTAITKADGTKVEGNVVLDGDRGIKRIAEGAFTGNTAVTYVKMPDGIVSIDENAFKGCTALKGMTIPTGVSVIGTSAFEGCSALTQFALPATIQTIGNRAFYGDAHLFMVYMRNIDISELTAIGDYAFYGCNELVDFCSDTSFTFPYELTTIGAYAFYDCRSVQSVTFPENVTTMGTHAFEACSALAQVSLSGNLTEVSEYGFADCRSLVTLKFGVGSQSMTIGSYAFKGCYNLGGVELLFNVGQINANAFLECSRLVRVVVTNGICVIEDNAFPDMETLYLIGYPGSTAETYAKTRRIQFIDINAEVDDNYYTCSVEVLGTGTGTVIVSTAKSTVDQEISDGDVKNANNGKGVKAGTTLYVYPTSTGDNKLVSGSLKYNGAVIGKDQDGFYTFTMPKGGAVVNVEFENTGGSTAIVGTDVTYELSNGDELKVGQTSRIFLLDADNKIVPTSKIKFVSDKPAVAKVSSTGMITALKEGLAHITMTVTGGNGLITKIATIQVKNSEVAFIKLTVTPGEYDKDIFEISEKTIGDNTIQVASITKQSVSYSSAKLPLKALSYDEDSDSMAVALKWTSSDAKVAKLSSATTAASDSYNEITIPQGASGEATITVTATNSDNETITQKFIIQVEDFTPRLSASTITLNPNKENGAVLQVISAYGKSIDPDSFKIVDAVNDKLEISDFKITYDLANSTNTVKSYIINALDGLDEKTYSVRAKIGEYTPIPLKITVKSSMPSPKVAFAKKQQKINLFYANDETEVIPVITNLGSEKIASYSLEPLTTSATSDDWMFTENFQIDDETGVITQKSDNMIYTDKGALIKTGYLVLHFEGYKADKVKKYKITIPTQNTKPSYKLDKTSDVYNTTAAERTVVLTLLDSKTKEPVALEDGEWTVEPSSKSTSTSVSRDDIYINPDGQIQMTVSARPTAGKIVLSVRNEEWAEGNELDYTYTIKTTNADPKIKLKSATINVNSNYAGQEYTFSLESNQCDTVLDESQSFVAKSTAKTAAEYDKVHVEYENGEGTVSVDPDIKAGSYKFYCEHVYGDKNEPYNSVTLTVKVVKTLPSMTVKGSAALNLAAVTDDEYTEMAELQLNVKLPEGYEIDELESVENISCTTKGMSEVTEKLIWNIDENVLYISLDYDNPVVQKTYSFTMTPVYRGEDGNSFDGKSVKFSVKVYKAAPSLKMSAKGVLNLLDRSGEYTLKNSIVYTPTFTNLKDTVEEVQIFDASGVNPELGDEESEYFEAEVLDGKIYVAPKEDAELANKKVYPIKMWVRLAGYGGYDGMWVPGTLNIKTAQILPKVTTSTTSLNLYLSNKDYESTFTVTPKEGSIGNAVEVVFDEKDTKSQDSFDVTCIPQDDGSVVVNVKLKDTVSFANDSTSKVAMYVMFEGQAVETVGPKITMNVKINK